MQTLGSTYLDDVAELGPQGGATPPAPPPSFGVAIAPIVAVVALNWVFSAHILPGLDSSYLATALYGATRLDAVLGTWAITTRRGARRCRPLPRTFSTV